MPKQKVLRFRIALEGISPLIWRSVQHLLEAILDPWHPEHRAKKSWAGGSFDPEDFDPANVQFDDPRERWNLAFADG